MRIPSITRLDSVPRRPCAWIVFSTTIVLDSEMSEPNQSAGRHSHPSTTHHSDAYGDRQDDLNRAADERDRADRSELSKRQFEPQRKQQERHAELGELLDSWTFLTVGPPVKGPTSTPARMYPTISGCPIRCAR